MVNSISLILEGFVDIDISIFVINRNLNTCIQSVGHHEIYVVDSSGNNIASVQARLVCDVRTLAMTAHQLLRCGFKGRLKYVSDVAVHVAANRWCTCGCGYTNTYIFRQSRRSFPNVENASATSRCPLIKKVQLLGLQTLRLKNGVIGLLTNGFTHCPQSVRKEHGT